MLSQNVKMYACDTITWQLSRYLIDKQITHYLNISIKNSKSFS